MLNRRSKVIRDKREIQLEYDANSNVTRLVEDKKESTYEYDENNRITEIRNALGEIVKRNKYNSEGQILEIKDGTGHGVSYVYDIGGRVSYLKTPKGEKYNKNTQSYSYDPWGNITSIIDAQGRNTKYDLDSWGRVTQILKPDNTRETYSYDHIGNIVETKDSNGNKIEYI